jgi:surface protein
MRRKNNRYLWLLLILLILSVGYAALSTTLKINGTTNIGKNTWSVYWDNVDNESGVSTTKPTIGPDEGENAKTEVSWSVVLDKPGDYYEFTVDAVNAGTIDAMITKIERKLNGAVISENNKLPDYIVYEVTYADGRAVENNHLLRKADNSTNPPTPTTQAYKVRVEYDSEAVTKTDINGMTDDVTYNFSFAVTYGQADNNAIDISVLPVLSSDRFRVLTNGMIDLKLITAVSPATTAQYNAVKSTLTAANIVSPSREAVEVTLATSADLSFCTENWEMCYGRYDEDIQDGPIYHLAGDQEDGLAVYAWLDGTTLYYYSPYGKIQLPEDSSFLFNGPGGYSYGDDFFGESILDLSGFDTSNVKNMNCMIGCTNADKKIKGINTTGWDTSKVTNMDSMFAGLTDITSLDLTHFNTENVTYMESMFQGMNSLETLDLSSFDTKNVTDMYSMFAFDTSLRTIYASDKFVTTKVTGNNSTWMFEDCTSIEGGGNTHYAASKTDKTYARIGTSELPGYFKAKN